MAAPIKNLNFRCTGCGNCCKDPVLPLTDDDIRRIVDGTGESPLNFVRYTDRYHIDMDDEPEAFASFRQGKRALVMRQGRGGCYFLGEDDRCTIYEHRPLGCRAFPFDPSYGKDKKLRSLKIIDVIECEYELDGKNNPAQIVATQDHYEAMNEAYYERVEAWNRLQRARRRAGKRPELAKRFLEFLGVLEPTVKER